MSESQQQQMNHQQGGSSTPESYTFHAQVSLNQADGLITYASTPHLLHRAQSSNSLRTQLLLIWMVLAFFLTMGMIILYQLNLGNSYVLVALAALMLLISFVLAYLLTTLILRPLFRILDVAQALSLGDLQQRTRLLPFLPPRNAIDRLAGSLNEMALRLQRAEESHHLTEQQFKRFFSDASHQLRTPLTSILGFAELLSRGAITDQETTQRVITRLKTEAERMKTLIQNLLTLARLNDLSLNISPVDLVSLGVDAIKQARDKRYQDHAVSLTLATQDRFALQADSERLSQLLFILLDNALKYGHRAPEGMVNLKLEHQGHAIVIRVIDNGPGIEKENLARIFDSFYRIPRTSKNAPGSGLGLTIARTIVQAHRGTISVSSLPDRGTEVKVILPLTHVRPEQHTSFH